MKINKVIIAILRFRLSERAEWVTAFWALLLFTVINEFSRKIIDFYNSSFFSIIIFFGILSLSIGFKELVIFFTNLDYIAITRRLMFCLSIGIILNFFTISGWRLMRSNYILNNSVIQTYKCPILSLNANRFNQETIEFLFRGRNRSVKIDLRSVSKLQIEGIETYCLYLKVKAKGDLIVIDSYKVEKCLE